MKKNTKEQNLKKYYYDNIWVSGLPAFESLTDEQKRELRSMLGFAVWMLGNEFDQVKKEIKLCVQKILK